MRGAAHEVSVKMGLIFSPKSKNMKKHWKTILLLFITAGAAFSYGVIFRQYKIFPYNQLRFVLYQFQQRRTQVLSDLNYPTYTNKKTTFETFSRPADVVMLGDSLTDGAEWEDVFPEVNIANRGIPGDTTLGALNRLDSVLSTQPQRVFVMLGFNDIALKISTDTAFENYVALLDALQAAGVEPVIQSTLRTGPSLAHLNPEIERLNTLLRQTAVERELLFIDLNPSLAPDGLLKSEFTTDDVHINGSGYAAWAEVIRAAVEETPQAE